MPPRNIEVRMEREEIEVTRNGIFPPYEADPARVFIPGPTTYFVTVDGVELPPMTPEQYEKWAGVALGHEEGEGDTP